MIKATDIIENIKFHDDQITYKNHKSQCLSCNRQNVSTTKTSSICLACSIFPKTYDRIGQASGSRLNNAILFINSNKDCVLWSNGNSDYVINATQQQSPDFVKKACEFIYNGENRKHPYIFLSLNSKKYYSSSDLMVNVDANILSIGSIISRASINATLPVYNVVIFDKVEELEKKHKGEKIKTPMTPEEDFYNKLKGFNKQCW